MVQNRFSVHFVVRNNRVDTDGFVPVYAKVNLNNENFLFSINAKILSVHWDSKKAAPNPKAKNFREVNDLIESFKNRLYAIYSSLVASQQPLSIQNYKTLLSGKEIGLEKEKQKTYYLIETATEHNLDFEKMIGIKYSYGSYKTTRLP